MRWYKDLVVYQIYPRSFMDSNNDGIGDLRGIISKLDYLKDLGVNCIWLSPIYSSPLDDMGYDISNYREIHEDYGTMEDFKEMIEGLHSRGIKLIMDLVINHTSDEHPWFIEASKDKNSPYHDYYHFKDKVPNNWSSFFGGSAWEYNEATRDYYLHLFSKKQPDLNWENPLVREEIKDILRFWLDLGVDGFRCDVINLISKKEGLPKTKGLPILSAKGIYINGPKMHDYLGEIKRDVFSKYDMFTVGECVLITPAEALSYIEEGTDELNLVFQFKHMESDHFLTKWIPRRFKLRRLKRAMRLWENELSGKAWNSLYFENHDQSRSINRFGNLAYRVISAKMLAVYMFYLQGTPFIYQGQEIGMTNAHYTTMDEYKDVESINMYKMLRKFMTHKAVMKRIKIASRDNARTPVQWNKDVNAGFSKVKPWLGVNLNFKEINIEDNNKDDNSILNFYKKLIELRKKHKVIVYGDYVEHYKFSNKLAVYERNFEGDKLLVICNFSRYYKRFKSPYDLSEFELLLNNYDIDSSVIEPYQTKVYLRSKKLTID